MRTTIVAATIPVGTPFHSTDLLVCMAGIDVNRGNRDESALTERREPPLRPGKIRQRTLRFRLACLVLACILPVWIAAGFVVYHAYQQKRSVMERGVLETSRALSMVVDRELAGMQAEVTALATSPALTAGDFAEFHRQARMLLTIRPGGSVVLVDASGQQLVNSYVPYGTPLPKRVAWEQVQKVLKTGTPVIINLFKGAITGRPVFGVAVPVVRDGRVVYALEMAGPANRLSAIFAEQRASPDWPTTVLDANRVVVARNLSAERYVGLPTVPALFEKLGGGTDEGIAEGMSREGVPTFAYFSRSPRTGWTVSIGVPRAVIMAGIRQWLWWTVGGAILLSTIGFGLALLLAKRISQSIHALISPAVALGAGEPVEIGQLDLMETDKVRQSLEEASKLLRQRTEERKQAEAALLRSEKLASVGRMAATIAHEINNPLEAVTNLLFLAKSATDCLNQRASTWRWRTRS